MATPCASDMDNEKDASNVLERVSKAVSQAGAGKHGALVRHYPQVPGGSGPSYSALLRLPRLLHLRRLLRLQQLHQRPQHPVCRRRNAQRVAAPHDQTVEEINFAAFAARQVLRGR